MAAAEQQRLLQSWRHVLRPLDRDPQSAQMSE